MTVIGPALGQAAVMNQATSYDAISARRFWSVGIQEGALSAGSYMVTQRGAGANLSVDVAASTGDGATVQGDAVTAQGLYHVAPHSTVINETITAAHATLPRIDQVVLEVKDHQHDASGSNLAQTRVVPGTATGGATLDNRTGAAALPGSAILLADVLVAATDTAISNSEIRDRRPWARGAYSVSTVAAGASYTTSSAAFAEIDATLLKPRIECSGVPVRVILDIAYDSNTADRSVDFDLFLDGVAQSKSRRDTATSTTASAREQRLLIEWIITPAAGSHRIAPGWRSPDGVAIMAAGALRETVFVVEELVRQNTANNTTTTG